MNKMRRKAIRNLIAKLSGIRNDKKDVDFDLIDDILDETQTILDDEEDYFYNIPENLQSGSRYDDSENAIDNLGDAINELSDIDAECSHEYIKECIDNAIDSLNNCI